MYHPPRPKSLPAVAALLRAVAKGDGDLLSLLPAAAYRMAMGQLGYSRRSIWVVNAPELVREIMLDPQDDFPKSDLMVGALEPMIGDSIFISRAATWRRQRRMVDPAFTHMRINNAFSAMEAAVTAREAALDAAAEAGEPVSLDLTMSHLAADIMTRTVFSVPFESKAAQEVFDAFAHFERHVAQVEIRRMIMDKAWTKVPQKAEVLAACASIRRHLGVLLDEHQARGGRQEDIAAAFVAARDSESGSGFTREELIDQLGVLFLAGHETTASALTWVFYILAEQPDLLARVRTEVEAVAGDGPITLEHTKRLPFVRNIFRETLRLYPPITFLPRVADRTTRIGNKRIKKGAMIIISPWTLHRNHRYWTNPDAFDPNRFSPEREGEQVPGAYIPFGLGPRICVGAGFAAVESALIVARLARRYDVKVLAPEQVRPVARLTTRPKEQIRVLVSRRS
ncbi:MAG: cytochrome P450 [Pseudomonadota bacterium]